MKNPHCYSHAQMRNQTYIIITNKGATIRKKDQKTEQTREDFAEHNNL